LKAVKRLCLAFASGLHSKLKAHSAAKKTTTSLQTQLLYTSVLTTSSHPNSATSMQSMTSAVTRLK
jgi:hypothetical protein